ncbi:TetR/AcrR family transcriptional regulator [Lactiplantibacillus mudanjiangensis]|uniref:HTH tetR-type domain-containing protein n=1 Tax=Lactiplantibacillus mudanjiangensis TaxID=1296538 RepID=A0A660E103_9LACO|nr:TetR/AcrR family transcriptional regulator [Lactiplantibacillus mudanjiangensis]VDG24385.1 hypothetical protein [Lactobacillus plantarum] [Lactiplantibacillus mudanjiangensis]VDG28187.1 hypothetical protein [Lactobacillus plantarum] [Lactiplantibacillus mudanjiangensis]
MQTQLKLTRILASAQAQFIVPGFADTKMVNIAKAADVAVGTLYTLVKSKSELLTLLFATTLDPTIITQPLQLPWRPLTNAELVAQTKQAYQTATRSLLTSIQTSPVDNQFDTLVTELFTTFDRFGAYFLTLERNPQMNPELMTLYRHYRQQLYHTISRILGQLSAKNVIRPLPNPTADAFIIIDEIFWWSAHKQYDSFERAATTVDQNQIKAAVIQQLLAGYQRH